ncbi:agc protein kinase [Plasmopara halstedii]|uniref:cGMP-dependent protein kinase n=1 Tax=Plasmopara halstedii TaxID=4781 RepID=A0A0P1AYS7_PLAHL|nr:agc protein kinase [Plasmopara halstedii]CEG46903.1 agc protein kinase [Plasmopara halstedii]|eukprot:XP_024583272.1 agc protein kinase [Plasmopara halstedii]
MRCEMKCVLVLEHLSDRLGSMGGGVSKREFDRITKELIIKDQVIRTLQERLANGSLESFSNDAADAHGMSSMMRKKDDRRVSLAELVPGPLSQRLDSVNTFHYEAKEALYEGTTQSKLDARSHNGLRDDEKVSSGQHDLIFSDGKSRRAEVSADVMPSRKIMATNERVVYPKGEKSRQLLLTILQSNVLFQGQSHGAQGDNFYAVETGQLEILVSTGDAPPIRYGFLGPGLGFGELALLYNMPRAATIRAVTEADLWAIERNTFREILASHKLNRLNRTLQVLQKIELLNKLTMSELQHVAAAMDWEEFEENAVIVRQGEVGEKFYIINKGEIVVKQVDVNTGVDNVIRKLKAGDHFGEMALFRDEMRSATCIATTRVQCITLERAHFIAMLGTLQELMDREPVCLESCDQADKRTITEELHEAAEYKYYKSISRDELEVLQTLGRGAFGRVRLVRHAASNRAYALKCLIKSHIVMNNLKEHVLNEKLVMLSLDHPFILKLYSTFKDQTHIYFLIELALGGELFTYLRRTDHFKESVARFYIASVVLVFQHMHSKSIIYRDLKPENILLDNQGYMKLADFGLAKVVTDRTWTLCGTPDYLAPEIILNKGHDKAVDYWALGILIFELMTGSAPFCARDPMQTYTLIIQGNVKFPTFTSRTCVDLVQKLLCQNPARRLGNMKHGMDDIINHRWFSKFDWDGLASKSMKPPIIPQVLDDFDTSNFEDFRNEVEDPGGECDWDPDF